MAGGLHVDRGALDDALETCGWGRFGTLDVRNQRIQFSVDVFGQSITQAVEVHATRLHHPRSFGFVYQSEQQVFQCCQLVVAFICKRDRLVNGCFERGGE